MPTMNRRSLAALARLLFIAALLAGCTSSTATGERSIDAPTVVVGDDTTPVPGSGATDAAATTATVDPEVDTAPAPRIVQIGAAAGRRPGQTPIDALRTVESVAGRQLDVLRTYAFWDSEFPNLRQQTASDEGRELHLSINARREDGTVVPWATIATAAPGSPVHNELTDWIERIAAFDGPLRVTFHHEADIEPEFGTADEFVQAWRRVADLLDEAAPDVPLVWVMTLFTISQPDEAERFWPGDDHVDWIAADAFNWFGCRGSAEAWRSPELLLDPLIAFGQAHPGKPLMFAEIGSDEDPNDPNRKADWFDELASLVAQDRYAAIETIIFFHNDHDDESSCDWWVDSGPETAGAFARFVAGDLFGGPEAPPPTAQCPIVSTTTSLVEDRAVVDGDGDGRYDFVFGLENRFVGIGDQANDGSDHRPVLLFDALDPLPAGATVELRVRVGERQPALPGPVQLRVVEGLPPSDRDAFTEEGALIEAAWFDDRTLGGHHSLDVTSHFDPSTPTMFRLQLESIPPNDDGKAPLFIGMGDASRDIDRPALVVRSC